MALKVEKSYLPLSQKLKKQLRFKLSSMIKSFPNGKYNQVVIIQKQGWNGLIIEYQVEIGIDFTDVLNKTAAIVNKFNTDNCCWFDATEIHVKFVVEVVNTSYELRNGSFQ